MDPQPLVPVEFTAYSDEDRVVACVDVPCHYEETDAGHRLVLRERDGDSVLLRVLVAHPVRVSRVTIRPQLPNAKPLVVSVQIDVVPGAFIQIHIGAGGAKGQFS